MNMPENLAEAISLDQAVERMAVARSDKPEEDDKPEDTGDGEPEVAAEDAGGEENEPEGEPEEEPSLEIELPEGKRKLTLSQIREGLMLKADYTRKTMAVAEERKAAEALATANSQRQQQLEDALKLWAVPTEQEPDWQALSSTLTPQDYLKRQAEWMERQKRSNAARDEYHRLRKAQEQEIVTRERERLLEAIPEWRNEDTFREATGKIVSAGQKYGFTQEELGGIVDHRMVRVLNDLAAYHALKDSNAATVKRVATVSPTLKPGAKVAQAERERAALQQQRAQLKKTGGLEDAAELLRLRRTS